jgi:arylsulfatase A-like enzyme
MRPVSAGAFTRRRARSRFKPRHLLIIALCAGAVAVGACDDGGSSEPPAAQATGAGGGTGAGSSGGAPQRPNVVVVMTDDQDVSSIAHLPRIQDLAGEGTTFSRAVATTPQCCPSRATFLTGQYAHNHGVLSNKAPDGGFAALDGTRTLPVWLSEAGYRTGHVGRYLNGYGNPAVGTDPLEIPPGWDDWQVPVNHTEFRMWDYTLNENGTLKRYGDSARDYQTDVIARKAAGFVRRNAPRAEPFFLSVASLAPHKEGVLDKVVDAPRNPRPAPRHNGVLDDLPIPRAPSYDEVDVSDKPRSVGRLPTLPRSAVRDLEILNRSRVESLLAVDDLVGRLVRALRKSGELENTLVIFTSDQGFLFGEHRLVGKGTLYEGAVRVPLIMRGPGIPPGAVRDQLVANVDLAPTILDVARAVPDIEQDGSSVLPIASDGSASDARSFLLELQRVPGLDEEARERSRDLRKFFEPETVFAVRSPGFFYAEHPNGEVELYDLDRDPDQLENVATDAEYRSALTELEGRLRILKSCRGAACR